MNLVVSDKLYIILLIIGNDRPQESDSNNDVGLIVGLSVGLGVPLITATIIIIVIGIKG